MRARSIKPGIFKNEVLGSADPLFAIIFAGLWCLADREGRLEDRALRIHVEINPYRPSASTVQALDWLCASRFIVRYEHSGAQYIAIPNFRQHQQPHIKEAPSKIPPPLNQWDVVAPVKHGANTGVAALTPDSGLPIPKVRPAATPRKKSQLTECPDGFALTDKMRSTAVARYPDCDTDAAFEQFLANHRSKGNKFANWPQAWATWIGNFERFGYPKRRISDANALIDATTGKPVRWS